MWGEELLQQRKTPDEKINLWKKNPPKNWKPVYLSKTLINRIIWTNIPVILYLKQFLITVSHWCEVVRKSKKLRVKFPHSPILNYAFSSWLEKTMKKTIHFHWENRFVLTIVWGCAETLPKLSNIPLNFSPI